MEFSDKFGIFAVIWKKHNPYQAETEKFGINNLINQKAKKIFVPEFPVNSVFSRFS